MGIEGAGVVTVQALCSLQTEQREAKARIGALAEIAAMVRLYGAERFARHLRLLVDSVARAQAVDGVIYSS
jgi:hypothetical protein